MLIEAYGFMTGVKSSLKHTSRCGFMAPAVMQMDCIVIEGMQSFRYVVITPSLCVMCVFVPAVHNAEPVPVERACTCVCKTLHTTYRFHTSELRLLLPVNSSQFVMHCVCVHMYSASASSCPTGYKLSAAIMKEGPQ